MMAFGSVNELLSYENVTRPYEDESGLSVHSTYKKVSRKDKQTRQKSRREKSIYDSSSSLARSIHLKYRVFSAFLYMKVNYQGASGWDKLTKLDKEAYKKYKDIILSDYAKEDVLQYLTWLEHRRWNAYMRSIGFSYWDRAKKNIYLKLHRCLCECSDKPINNSSASIRKDSLIDNLKDIVCPKNDTGNKCEESKDNLSKNLVCFINSWQRLPADKELIKLALLSEKIKNKTEELYELNLEYNRTEQEDTRKNIVEKVKTIISTVVDECINETVEAADDGSSLDRLDGASEKNKSDMKFYDYPKDTDTKLVDLLTAAKKGAK